MLSSRHRPRCRFRHRCTRYRQRAGMCVLGVDIGERNQAKRTGTWRRMNMLRFSESKTLNSVMISQM